MHNELDSKHIREMSCPYISCPKQMNGYLSFLLEREVQIEVYSDEFSISYQSAITPLKFYFEFYTTFLTVLKIFHVTKCKSQINIYVKYCST